MGEPGGVTRNGPVTRRRLLTVGGGAVGAAWAIGAGPRSAYASGQRPDPFTLGVASGDPGPDAVVIWTRLAPDPLHEFGGMPDRTVPVRWEVAESESFRGSTVVRRGVAHARRAYVHTVHVDVRGLAPGRVYYYRFRYGRHVSPTGRTKTAPAAGAHLDQLALAIVSCQKWEHGFYTAYRHLAEEELDLVFHLGDYIYETGIPAGGGQRDTEVPEQFRNSCRTLDRYRIQYALYKSDPHLQAAHAAFPFAAIEDDHEVGGNWIGAIGDDPDRVVRQANAYRAYWEHMPFRPLRKPDGWHMQVYRRFSYGDLATFNLLDGRQYRSGHACGTGGLSRPCEEVYDPDRVYLGSEQEEWLLDGLASSKTSWNVLPQQQVFVGNDQDPSDDLLIPMDNWNGYQAARQRVLDGIVERNVENVIVLTGDAHCNYASNILADFSDPDSAVIGSEFVGTSIASGKDGSDMAPRGRKSLASNPWIKFFNDQRGYVRCTVTPQEWRTDFKVVPYVTKPGAPIKTRASYVVENGHPGLEKL